MKSIVKWEIGTHEKFNDTNSRYYFELSANQIFETWGNQHQAMLNIGGTATRLTYLYDYLEYNQDI